MVLINIVAEEEQITAGIVSQASCADFSFVFHSEKWSLVWRRSVFQLRLFRRARRGARFPRADEALSGVYLTFKKHVGEMEVTSSQETEQFCKTSWVEEKKTTD